MTINTQKIVNVLSGFTGPTGTFEVVNIIPNFTGPTGLYPQWAAYTGPTGASMAKGVYKDVINIGPTGPSSVSPSKGIKTVIIPGFAGGGGGAGSVWNPADASASLALTSANKTAANNTQGGVQGVRGVTSHATGKFYLEQTVTHIGGFHSKWGFANALQVLTNYDTTHSFGVTESGGLDTPTGGSLGASPAGHTIGLAIDIDNGLWWARYDGGSWLGVSGTSDPATGLNGSDYTGNGVTKASAVFPAFIGFANASPSFPDSTIETKTFAHTAPTGFLPWG